jgi:hypothetical protein
MIVSKAYAIYRPARLLNVCLAQKSSKGRFLHFAARTSPKESHFHDGSGWSYPISGPQAIHAGVSFSGLHDGGRVQCWALRHWTLTRLQHRETCRCWRDQSQCLPKIPIIRTKYVMCFISFEQMLQCKSSPPTSSILAWHDRHDGGLGSFYCSAEF